MSTSDSELDRRLRALFGGLDTGAHFDTRLMARLRAESQSDATARAMQARQQELTRHQKAVGRRRSTLWLLALDTLGISLLLTVAVILAWPRYGAGVTDIWREYGEYIAMSLAALIAAVPLVGTWAERSRRAPRF